MELLVIVIIGVLSFACGAACGAYYLAARRRSAEAELSRMLESERKEKAVAETRLEAAARHAEDQKRLLDDAQAKLLTAFQALSGESLKSNNKAFLDLARESLDRVMGEARGEMDKKETAIRNLVRPLEEALARYETQVGQLERSRLEAYAGLESQIRTLISSETRLQQETGNLVAALRRPEVRGRWGEITLRRVVELAGMSGHCDYTEQVSVTTDTGRLRPDMIVHLPGGRDIVIDSKVSLDAYLDSIASQDPEKRAGLVMKHAQQVRRHMKTLSEKGYWEQFPRAPEFVVMFIPGESFLAAALDVDAGLIEEGMESRVIIATPSTLIALLRAIAFGWRQERVTENAQKIAAIGKEIYDRFQPFLEHANRVSVNLSQAVDSFNRMIRSLETRVMVSVRKFRELGASGDRDLPDLQEVEQTPLTTQDQEASRPS